MSAWARIPCAGRVAVVGVTALALLAAAAQATSATTAVAATDDRAGASIPVGTLVVLNKSGASASLLDLPGGGERARVATGAGPHEVALSPDGSEALVADYGLDAPGRTLTRIDLARGAAIATWDLDDAERPHGVVWVGDRVWVTAERQQALLGLEAGSGERVASLPTGAALSHMVAVTPDGRRGFTSNLGDGSVSAFDLASGERTAVIASGDGAEGIALSPDGRELWVSNRAAGELAVFDATSLERLATVPMPGFPIRLAFTPDGATVLASRAADGALGVVDARSRAVRATIAFERRAVAREGRLLHFGDSPVPIGIAVSPSGRHAWVALSTADVVAEVDLDEGRVLRYLPAGPEPDGVAFSPVIAGE